VSGRPDGERDPHRRFAEWLLASADDDPPRDLAVHASLCPDCQRQIAALDMLTGIEPANAGTPPIRAGGAVRRNAVAGRVAVAVGGVAAVAAIGVGGWRLIEATGLGIGAGGESPTQEVLGNTGQPEATHSPIPSHAASEQASPTTTVEASAQPTVDGSPGLPPVTLPPASIPSPTAGPTRTPRPTSNPRGSTAPSPTPAPTATPAPTETPPEVTPTPNPEETPTPVAEAA